MPLDIPEPWGAFLRDLDRELGRPVELHCLGGFRPCLGNPEREDLTLKLWIEAIEEKRKGNS
jgi:hypothetical protein